jgi:hypothetical protein
MQLTTIVIASTRSMASKGKSCDRSPFLTAQRNLVIFLPGTLARSILVRMRVKIAVSTGIVISVIPTTRISLIVRSVRRVGTTIVVIITMIVIIVSASLFATARTVVGSFATAAAATATRSPFADRIGHMVKGRCCDTCSGSGFDGRIGCDGHQGGRNSLRHNAKGWSGNCSRLDNENWLHLDQDAKEAIWKDPYYLPKDQHFLRTNVPILRIPLPEPVFPPK